jgi:hypothetical protein
VEESLLASLTSDEASDAALASTLPEDPPPDELLPPSPAGGVTQT